MVDDTPGRRRRGGGLYPLWLGGAALIGLTGLWFGAADDAAPAVAAVVDAEAVVSPAADAGPAPAPPTRLHWTIGPRPPVDAAVLDGCLAEAGYDRAAAVGFDPIVVTLPGRVRPMAVRATTLDGQPAVEVSTPVEADARLSATLHVAATACLYAEGAAVYDPLFDRRLSGRDWPQLGESGGLPVHHLVDVDDVAGGLRTRGLMRLGRPELGLAVDAGSDGAAGLRIIRAYAAAAVVGAAGMQRLERSGGHAARLIEPAEARAAGWWTAADVEAIELRVLADAGSDPPKPVALPRPAPARAPARAPTRRPVTARPPRAEEPGPKPPRPKPPQPKPRPAPKAPVPFSPAYR